MKILFNKFKKNQMMQSIYEYLFGKDLQADELQQIQEDCSGLKDPDLVQPFCRQTVGYPFNPQLEEAKEKDAKRKERIRLRQDLQSPKPVKPFRLVNANMSYKDILMK